MILIVFILHVCYFKFSLNTFCFAFCFRITSFQQGHDIAPHSAPGTDGNAGHEVEFPRATSSPQKLKGARAPVPEKGDAKKKKKGIFGGLFGGKKGKKSKDADKSERTASRTRGLRSPMGRKLKNPTETSA